jgi:succinoglycan biosynthesis transport protein ExoP
MSQEIQLVNQNLPLQPALGPQALAPAGVPEQTPFRRIHQLLRGRYALAGVLATIGAVTGAAAGVLLPKPAWESIAVVKVHPVIPTAGPSNQPKDFPNNYLANLMVELHTERVIRKAMESPVWKQHRPYPGDSPPPEQVFEFSKNLTVKPMPFAPEMIQIIYDDSKPDARDVTQVAVKSIIEAFQSIWADTDTVELDQKIQYLQTRKNNVDLEISANQKAIQGLTKEVGDDDTPMLNARIANLLALDKDRKQAHQMLDAAQHDRDMRRQGLDGSNAYSADDISRVDPQMLNRLNLKNEANVQLQNLETKYGQNSTFPQVQALREQLATREKDIEDATKRFNDSYFIQQRNDGSPGTAIPKDLSKLKSVLQLYEDAYAAEDTAIKDIYARHSQIMQYKADIATKDGVLAEYEHEIRDLTFAKDLGGAGYTVIDDGSAPMPATDRRPVFAALGFMAGGAIPIGFLLLIGLANPRYRFSDEAGDDMTGLNLLGILPDLPDRLSDPEQASIAAHCVHQIRTMLQISGAPDERRVFAITSAAPGDGKTSLTLALGLSYAACGARTLLIDCDLVGAGLTSRMNVSSPVGVLEAIANRSLFEYVRTTEVADVSILPVGTGQTLHASTLSPAALRRVIDEARKHYDTILIDTGPILGSIEASLVCAAADAVVLAVARGQQRPLVERSIARLHGIGAKLAGVVFNRAHAGDFDRSISGASSLRSASAGNGHNGQGGPRYGTLGRAVHSNSRNADPNEG